MPDLRLCLDFEDPSLDPVIHDLSTGSHDAFSLSIDTWQRDGQQAAALDWGSLMTVPESPDLDIPKNLTVEMWLNPDGDTTAYPLRNRGQYQVGIDQQALFCQFGNQYVHAKTHIAVDAWTHVACTYDGTTVTAYVDGSVSACWTSSTPNTITNSNSTGTQIGASYSGAIDDVHVYARTLDAGQIRALAGVTTGTTACSGKDD